jgi:capsid assembly protease
MNPTTFERLPHLAARVIGTPLMIEPAKLDILLQVLAVQEGQRHAPPVIEFGTPDSALSSATPSTAAQAGIAVIQILGSLVKRNAGMEALSGLMSYDRIAAQLQAALGDPSVRGIVLEIDSPGGEAAGVFDLADAIRIASAQKPVYAVVSDRAYSAAYALASSANRIYVSRTAGVGSIGVIAMHVDQSARDAQQGLRYTPVFAGARKNDLNPHAPITDSARATLQGEVDRLYGLFVNTVAAHRNLNAQTVRDTQAGVFFADATITAGLADMLGTLDDALADLRSQLEGGAPAQVVAGAIHGGHDPPVMRLSANLQPPSLQSPVSVDPGFVVSNGLSTSSRNPMNTPEPSTAAPAAATPAASASIAATPSPATVPPTANPTPNPALAIADLCLLAGLPERTAEFLARGVGEDVVRRELLAARAQGASASTADEIASRVVPGALLLGATSQAPVASLETNPVVLAAKQRAALAA